jgi:beta-fructofuranosidase
MVFQDPVTGDWIMYITSTEDGAVASNYVVKACSPTDATLFDWGSCSVVYADFHVGKTYGPTESPFVVARTNGGVTAYYLFIGPRPYDPPGNPPYNWQEPGYLGTDVFRSLDPRHWDNAQYIGHIAAHAAEVIQDGAQYYVSSAGTDQGVNALNVAPLTWLNGY